MNSLNLLPVGREHRKRRFNVSKIPPYTSKKTFKAKEPEPESEWVTQVQEEESDDGRGGAVNIHNVASTQVLVMMNMLSKVELVDDEEYEDVMDDIRLECVKAGEVISVKIPRPSADGSPVPGLGKVFVEFATIKDAEAGQGALSGRKFGDKTVVTSFLTLEKYKAGKLGAPLSTFWVGAKGEVDVEAVVIDGKTYYQDEKGTLYDPDSQNVDGEKWKLFE